MATKKEQIKLTLAAVEKLLLSIIDDPKMQPTAEDKARLDLQRMLLRVGGPKTNALALDVTVKNFIDGATRLEAFTEVMVIMSEFPEIYNKVNEALEAIATPDADKGLTDTQLVNLPTAPGVM